MPANQPLNLEQVQDDLILEQSKTYPTTPNSYWNTLTTAEQIEYNNIRGNFLAAPYSEDISEDPFWSYNFILNELIYCMEFGE